MANIEKYDIEEIDGLLNHYSRATISDNVDISRTDLNYNLAPAREISERDYLQKLLDANHHINRKDLKVAFDVIVTCPQNVPENLHRRFFEESYRFLVERYGGSRTGLTNADDNIISAHVHLDEKTPHMHVCIAPIRFDEKKGISKFDCKNIVNRQDLRTLHSDLSCHMQNVGLGAAAVHNHGTLYKKIEINGNEKYVPCSLNELRSYNRERLHERTVERNR